MKYKIRNYIVIFLATVTSGVFFFTNTGNTTEEMHMEKIIKYINTRNDDLPTIAYITNKYVEIMCFGNSYNNKIKTVGSFKGSINQDQYSKLCMIINNERFIDAPTETSLQGSDSIYSQILVTQNGNTVLSKMYSTQVSPSQIIIDAMRLLDDIIIDTMLKVEPEIGLTVAMGDIVKTNDTNATLTVYVENKGSESLFLIDSRGMPFQSSIKIASTRSAGQEKAYFSAENVQKVTPANIDGSAHLEPHQTMEITYVLPVDKLPAQIGYICSTHTFRIKTVGSANELVLNFFAYSDISPPYKVISGSK